MLAPVFDPLGRTAEAKGGERDQHVLRVKLAANAETPADMALAEMHRRWATPERAGEQVACPVRHLRGAVQLEGIARAVVPCERAARFQRNARMAPYLEVELGDQLGGVLGQVCVFREDGCDRLPDIVDPLACQYRLQIGGEVWDFAFAQPDG